MFCVRGAHTATHYKKLMDLNRRGVLVINLLEEGDVFLQREHVRMCIWG